MLDLVVHTFNPCPWEAEAGRPLLVGGQPGLQSDFQDSDSYIVRPCLVKTNKNYKSKNQLGDGGAHL